MSHEPPPGPAKPPADSDVLQTLVEQLVAEFTQSRERIAKLEHQLQLLVRKLYGARSEKVDPRQQSLFDKDAEGEIAPAEPPAPEPASHRLSGKRRRPRPDTLERRDVVHDLSDEEKRTLAGDGELVLLGEEIAEQDEWEPSCVYVLRHIQRKYARRPALLESGATPETKNVVTARKPPQPIPGGQAGPGLLAWLITSRFCDHLPYHRQERPSFNGCTRLNAKCKRDASGTR